MVLNVQISIATPTLAALDKIFNRPPTEYAGILSAIKVLGDRMNAQISQFATDVAAAFAKVDTALDNITSDEKALADQIQALKDQIAAGNSNLTPEDQAALDAVVSAASAMATKTQGIADSVPDAPTPPAG